MVIKGILLGFAAFLAVALMMPRLVEDRDYMGTVAAAIVGILVAVAVALPG